MLLVAIHTPILGLHAILIKILYTTNSLKAKDRLNKFSSGRMKDDELSSQVMEILTTKLREIKVLKPAIHSDHRGFFLESYRHLFFQQNQLCSVFVQENHSYSKKNTLRGLHFQAKPGQDKLIRVVKGKIFDVAVDIRPSSPTYKQWVGIYLDDCQHLQLLIPKGFAHGFCVVSDEAHVIYKVSTYYDSAEEKTIRYDDPQLAISWPVDDPIISIRDQNAPLLSEVHR